MKIKAPCMLITYDINLGSSIRHTTDPIKAQMLPITKIASLVLLGKIGFTVTNIITRTLNEKITCRDSLSTSK